MVSGNPMQILSAEQMSVSKADITRKTDTTQPVL